MAKTLTQKIQSMINNADIPIKFIFKINNIDYTSYLITWSLESSKEFGSASATFALNNDQGVFSAGGEYKLEIGDIVEFLEYFGDDPTEFKKFYGIINQRSISKTAASRVMNIACLDYIATMQFLDIDLEVEGTKVEITDELLTPIYLPSPNYALAQVFNFANNALADNPRPIIVIKNKDTDVEDPQYDGFEIYYDQGQLKLGFPLNALYNYDVTVKSYYYYTKGVYVEDALQAILIEPDGYGKYLFGEPTVQAFIDNHLTTSFLNTEGRIIDYLTPNYTASEITINTNLITDYDPNIDSTQINVTDTSGFPDSGTGSINGDTFSWTGRTSTTLTGIPATGEYSLNFHKTGSYVKYTNTYAIGQVWYLTYSNLFTILVSDNFTVPGSTVNYIDKKFGRIILTNAIATTTTVTCNVDYSFNTLQATGIELNYISFRSRELQNRFEAITKLRKYLAPNYIIRTIGDNKIWSSYLYQKVVEDYTLELATSITYLEDEDLYTRTLWFGKNKNPTNLMFKPGIDFSTTGETYKAIATMTELSPLRTDDNYYIYGSAISGSGKITGNRITPVVYINGVPIDNTSHQIISQAVILEVTTKTDTTVEGGGK